MVNASVDDVFSGPDNFFLAFAPDARPEKLVDKLGERFLIAPALGRLTSERLIEAMLASRENAQSCPDSASETVIITAASDCTMVPGSAGH